MTSIKPFQATDLFELNQINLDSLTENFYINFYLQYLSEWPSLFFKSTAPSSSIANQHAQSVESESITGYLMGKTEGKGKEWHAHISAVTINPNYRRLSLASYLCKNLEIFTEGDPYNAYFIDLFVKVTNSLAITLYEKLGYSVYRRVISYYGGGDNPYNIDRKKKNDEIDAYDMRLSMKRDTKKETVRENGRNVHALPHEIVF